MFLMGGAQAVAALAYGTETVPKVDKIVGPGNIFVATAKKLLYGTVDIDMIAGPSEILVLADETADPAYVAADLMSQAEHDRLASAILLTTSREAGGGDGEGDRTPGPEPFPEGDHREVPGRISGRIIVCREHGQAVDLANEIAPEHLEVMLENPFEYLGRLDNAGSVFLGQVLPGAFGGLLRRAQPRAAHQRHRPVLLAAVGGQPLSRNPASSIIPRTRCAEAREDIVRHRQAERG